MTLCLLQEALRAFEIDGARRAATAIAAEAFPAGCRFFFFTADVDNQGRGFGVVAVGTAQTLDASNLLERLLQGLGVAGAGCQVSQQKLIVEIGRGIVAGRLPQRQAPLGGADRLPGERQRPKHPRPVGSRQLSGLALHPRQDGGRLTAPSGNGKAYGEQSQLEAVAQLFAGPLEHLFGAIEAGFVARFAPTQRRLDKSHPVSRLARLALERLMQQTVELLEPALPQEQIGPEHESLRRACRLLLGDLKNFFDLLPIAQLLRERHLFSNEKLCDSCGYVGHCVDERRVLLERRVELTEADERVGQTQPAGEPEGVLLDGAAIDAQPGIGVRQPGVAVGQRLIDRMCGDRVLGEATPGLFQPSRSRVPVVFYPEGGSVEKVDPGRAGVQAAEFFDQLLGLPKLLAVRGPVDGKGLGDEVPRQRPDDGAFDACFRAQIVMFARALFRGGLQSFAQNQLGLDNETGVALQSREREIETQVRRGPRETPSSQLDGRLGVLDGRVGLAFDSRVSGQRGFDLGRHQENSAVWIIGSRLAAVGDIAGRFGELAPCQMVTRPRQPGLELRFSALDHGPHDRLTEFIGREPIVDRLRGPIDNFRRLRIIVLGWLVGVCFIRWRRRKEKPLHVLRCQSQLPRTPFAEGQQFFIVGELRGGLLNGLKVALRGPVVVPQCGVRASLNRQHFGVFFAQLINAFQHGLIRKATIRRQFCGQSDRAAAQVVARRCLGQCPINLLQRRRKTSRAATWRFHQTTRPDAPALRFLGVGR